VTNKLNITLLKQLAHGIAAQFGTDCEVVIHDVTSSNLESTVIYTENGQITNRKIGDGPSHVVLKALKKDPNQLEDKLGYLTQTSDGRILKSSTIYIRDDSGKLTHILAINYDITNLLLINRSLESFIEKKEDNEPERITHNVNDLLDDLIRQSVESVGKPVALMTRDDKIAALEFLKDSGAFLITRAGDKITKYFGISKYTLYNYIDINK
jgi:predicted transcriptional regulator YheO